MYMEFCEIELKDNKSNSEIVKVWEDFRSYKWGYYHIVDCRRVLVRGNNDTEYEVRPQQFSNDYELYNDGNYTRISIEQLDKEYTITNFDKLFKINDQVK